MAQENDLQNAVCEYLEIKKYFFWRQNTAPTVQRQADGTMRFRKMGRYSKNGIPDVHVLTDKGVVYLEIKSPKGVLSIEQREFQKACIEKGIAYHIIKTIDEVMKIL